jgi:uronate dehydrogenase
MTADLRDRQAMIDACAGAHGVLHLGGIADEARFDDLSEVNIVGTFNVLEAARLAGATRVVYASSNRLTGFYPRRTVVEPEMPPRPDGLYGASKVAGEALGRLYSDKFGLSFIAIRIGSFEEIPQDLRQLSTWLSPRDCAAAFLAAMQAPGVRYAAFYGVSANTRRFWDLDAGHRLGFDPVDNAEDHAADIDMPSPPSENSPQGGFYASPEFTLQFLDDK